MKKNGKINFIIGFLLGAMFFGTMSAYAATEIIAKRTTSKVLLNDKEISVEAYNINGRNYFQLAQLGEMVGFDVTYDAKSNAVNIHTDISVSVPISTITSANITDVKTTEPKVDETAIESDNDFLLKYKVGDFPAHIIRDEEHYNVSSFDPETYTSYTDFYKYGLFGECAWYAKGRFFEVTGVDITTEHYGNPKVWLTAAPQYGTVKAITDLMDIRSKSIAVYKPTKDADRPGHAVFIEYVERGSNGKPINVYFTEANGSNTLSKGKFDYGYDGAVQKVTFEKFKTNSGELIGYLVPQK